MRSGAPQLPFRVEVRPLMVNSASPSKITNISSQ